MYYKTGYWKDIELVVRNIPHIENLYGKTILITGATGMVCSTVVDIIIHLNRTRIAQINIMLAGRNKDKLIKRFQGMLLDNDFYYVEYDALKSMEIDVKVDYIIHGASNANPTIYSAEPVETLLGNIVGLNSILKVAKTNCNSRLLYISSSEVYGIRTPENNEPYKEDDYEYIDILNPRACYPNSKRTAETLCICYGDEYGVDTVIVRLGHIYGPSITETDTRASAAFTQDVTKGRNIIMKSAGTQLRSYCYSLDCASAILTVLINGKTSNAYNISNKNSIVSIKDIAEEMAKIAKVNVIYENPSDKEQRSYNLMNNSVLNSEKIESLGWKPLFNLSLGVKKTLEYYSNIYSY